MALIVSVPLLDDCDMARLRKGPRSWGQGGPQGCPTPANSDECSAQIDPDLSKTFLRFGRKTPCVLDSGDTCLQGRLLGLAQDPMLS